MVVGQKKPLSRLPSSATAFASLKPRQPSIAIIQQLPVLEQHQHSAGLSKYDSSSYLDEADILALLPEALSADIETVLSDQTGCVGADAAVGLSDIGSAAGWGWKVVSPRVKVGSM